MNTETLLQKLGTRYACKKFDDTKQIPEATWAALEEAVRLAPSSFGLQPWKFIVVKDKALRATLRKHSWDQNQVETASHLVVIATRTAMSEKEVQAHLENIAQTRNVPLEALKDYAWPGNVRELSNLVDRFNTLFSGQLLSLATVPSSLLPKGLRTLQAQRVSTPIADALEIVSPLGAKDMLQSANAEVMNPFANPAPPLTMDLHNEVEDIIMLAQGLPSLPPEGLSLKDRLADIERDLIVQALNRTDGNVSQTARLLNLQRTTLIEKLNKYDLRQGTLPVANNDLEKDVG